MSGRTARQHTRVYIDGYDMSGYAHTVGTLGTRFDTENMSALTDAVEGGLPNQPHFSVGPINAVFDNTATTSMHVLFSAPSATRVIMIPIGIETAPVAGDPCWSSQNYQMSYLVEAGEVLDTATMEFGEWDVDNLVSYQKAWGHLLLPLTAKTGANSSTSDHDHGASTAFGGYMCYQVTAGAGGDGKATITVQHADTDLNGSFGALGGCTSGELDMRTPKYGIVETTTATTTVEQYLRWQLALSGGGATSVTFALSFVRHLW